MFSAYLHWWDGHPLALFGILFFVVILVARAQRLNNQ